MRLGEYDFDETEFTYQGKTRKVFRKGSGPGIVIMHEIPGITPDVARFAELVSREGFTVFLPVMFGTPGKPKSKLYVWTEMARACVSREFNTMAKHESSPITEWLRGLCRHVYEEIGGRGVGAIGMCLTGGFALSLMVDEFLMAPVVSQPSLPLFGSGHEEALGISDGELQVVKQRARSGVSVLGLRFSEDKVCPAQRFERLRQELGDEGFDRFEIDSSEDNPFNETIKPQAHSVLTTELRLDVPGHPTQEALNKVLRLFRERLL